MSLTRKDLGILVDTKWTWITSMPLSLRKLMVFWTALSKVWWADSQGWSFPSVPVKLDLEKYVQFWAPKYKRDMELLEKAQQWMTKMIKGLVHPFSEEGPRELGQNRRLKETSVVYKYHKGGCKEDEGSLFSVVPSDSIRGCRGPSLSLPDSRCDLPPLSSWQSSQN